MEYGKRLLPQVVDHYARLEPTRVYASVPRSAVDLADGFQDVTMAKLASIVNSLSWWLEGTVGVGSLNAIAYIGPADIRYAAMFLAAVKCGYKVCTTFLDSHVHKVTNCLERFCSYRLGIKLPKMKRCWLHQGAKRCSTQRNSLPLLVH